MKTLALETSSYELEPEIKRQIFEKFLNRLNQWGSDLNGGSLNFCPELNPDVIVISSDQTLMLEPQNLRASQWLLRRFRFSSEEARERICVHPVQSQGIVDELRAAGFAVTC
jgi:hypothetical protein